LCSRPDDGACNDRLQVFSEFFHALVGTHPGTVPIYVPQHDGGVLVSNQEGALDKVEVVGVCGDCRSDLWSNIETPTQPILDRIARGPAYSLTQFDVESLARWALATTLLAASAEPQKFCGNVRDVLHNMVSDYGVPASTALYAFGMREGQVARVEFRNIKATDVATGDCLVVGAVSIIGLPHLTFVSLYGSDSGWLQQAVDYFSAATTDVSHVQLWPTDSSIAVPLNPEISAHEIADLFLAYGPADDSPRTV
jgi:hypothetical protein